MALESPLKNPPIFVCGVQRAGTTLLVKMLNKDKSISFLPQETHLFPLLWNSSGKFDSISNNKELSDFLEKKWPEVNYGWIEAPDFLQEICTTIRAYKTPITSTEDLLEIILKIWEQKIGENCTTGEKTPSHIYYARKKLKKFPKCKMIVMCRDPRAAALSEMVKLKNNPRVDRDFNTFNFVVRYGTATALIEQLNQLENVLFLRYEDLISSPSETLQKACKFLNIPFEESMLDVGVTNSSFQDKKQKGIQFNTQNLNRWSTELPSEIIELIEFHLGKTMKKLDYKLASNAKPTIGFSKKLKQQIKFKGAIYAAKIAPSLFHHSNRNKKYR